MEKGSDTRTGLNVCSVGVLPPATTDLMLETLHVCKGARDVMARRLVIRENTTETEDCVPALKNFCGVEKRWSEKEDVPEYVNKNVQFRFLEYALWVDGSPYVENVIYQYLEIGLSGNSWLAVSDCGC